MPGLKICGLTRADDLAHCDRAGVDAVGINLWSGSRRGLSIPEAARLLAGTGGAQRVGVFVDFTPHQAQDAARTLGLDLLQPHGDAPPQAFAELGWPWVWVVRGTPELQTLRVPTPTPAWVLLDAAVPGFGGAGVRTDWDWAAKAVRALAPVPVWLAGGIDPDNAATALTRVNPAGLDVASGAEAPGATRGAKDPARIDALLRATRANVAAGSE